MKPTLKIHTLNNSRVYNWRQSQSWIIELISTFVLRFNNLLKPICLSLERFELKDWLNINTDKTYLLKINHILEDNSII
jgi:hypothetical protein